ncbi:uncharacterized protein Aud_002624 [Aspergillus udagawae]|uniref:Mid2 domain-containing protein n=1 Tax=Aspergillus udagawae TaxID=91492 RepID=A0A8E0QNK7_9EURO|nr:uncharacterized protein Aud_002624 [Aspergillus udagawae]GIC86256.1 hypothetical protein Aud_002624 [Aspergillus udagawae]
MAVYNLLLGLSAFISIARAAETCYWPNGKATPSNWVPCPNSKVCCAVGEACLSNNLCYGSKLNIAYRGACTDISWPIADCPRICYEEVDYQWANLYACPNNTNQVFTCGTSGWASSVCDAKLGLYTWVDGNVSLAQNGISTTFSSSSSSSAVGTLASPSQSTTTTTTPFSSGDSVASATATGNSQQDKNVLTLGLGLGIALGVPLLAISAAFLWLWFRTRRQSVNGRIQQPVGQYSGGAPGMAPAYRSNGGMGELEVPKSNTYRPELE